VVANLRSSDAISTIQIQVSDLILTPISSIIKKYLCSSWLVLWWSENSITKARVNGHSQV